MTETSLPNASGFVFERDATHWLLRLSPDEWIRAGLTEVRRAAEAFDARNARAGDACAKRGAGMALNGALIVEPDERWGRSYVDHLMALSRDPVVPERVREACRELTLVSASAGPTLIALRTRSSESRILEAARDIIAHAYAIVARYGGTS